MGSAGQSGAVARWDSWAKCTAKMATTSFAAACVIAFGILAVGCAFGGLYHLMYQLSVDLNVVVSTMTFAVPLSD